MLQSPIGINKTILFPNSSWCWPAFPSLLVRIHFRSLHALRKTSRNVRHASPTSGKYSKEESRPLRLEPQHPVTFPIPRTAQRGTKPRTGRSPGPVLVGFERMRCYVEFISVPTADTPGTLLFLHYDQRRYLIGRVSEGSTRVCIERGIGLRKVSDIILTGRTEWSNVGGLLGMMLCLADTKSAAVASMNTLGPRSEIVNSDSRGPRQKENVHINIFGAPNLNHLFASSRRFIFRTGMPVNVRELSARETTRKSEDDFEPTWKDDHILVWPMAVLPDRGHYRRLGLSRKRGYKESDDVPEDDADCRSAASNASADALRKSIVNEMFNSSWRYDKLVARSLSEIPASTLCFTRDPVTNRLSQYTGPRPSGNDSAPDITVLAREPWPATSTTCIPPTQPALEALSYIIKNHPQRGRFLPERADELGIPKSSRGTLTNGYPVINESGDEITPDMVLEPGKAGSGFAVIDVPDVDYLEPILRRPEWQSEKVMGGVEVIIWILGPKIARDSRLQKFQRERPHMKHLISSPECCANIFALEGAATNAMCHNLVDDVIFPNLEWSDAVEEVTEGRVARPGQIIALTPNVAYEDQHISSPLDPQNVKTTLFKEMQSHEAVVTALDSSLGSMREAKSSLQSFGDVEIIVLGTGSSHPGKYRNVSGTLVRIPDWGSCLFDSGEGTLNTLRRMFSDSDLQTIIRDLRIIWVSHMHADHHLGITSLLKSWIEVTDQSQPRQDLAVVSDSAMLHWLHEYSTVEGLDMSRILLIASEPMHGPSSSEKHAQLLQKQPTRLRFVDSRSAAQTSSSDATGAIADQLGIESFNTVYVRHCRGAQAVSIVFKSGFKISYSGDCRPNSEFTLIGRGSHVLVHEATLEDDMRAEAIAKRHSTAGEALVVASRMQAKTCLLTHFSQRYPKMPPLGVSNNNTGPKYSIQGLNDVLEEVQDVQSTAPDIAVDVASNASAVDLHQTDHTSTERTIQSRNLPVLDERDIRSLMESNQLSVLFAFDYMRLKLKDVPRLEAKQHVLRQILDLEISKVNESDEQAETLKVKDQQSKSVSKERRKQQKHVNYQKGN